MKTTRQRPHNTLIRAVRDNRNWDPTTRLPRPDEWGLEITRNARLFESVPRPPSLFELSSRYFPRASFWYAIYKFNSLGELEISKVFAAEVRQLFCRGALSLFKHYERRGDLSPVTIVNAYIGCLSYTGMAQQHEFDFRRTNLKSGRCDYYERLLFYILHVALLIHSH